VIVELKSNNSKEIIDKMSDRDKKCYQKNLNFQAGLNIKMGICKYQEIEIDNYWKTFDSVNNNYHIVPVETRKIQVNALHKERFKDIRRIVKQGGMPWTRQHKWIEKEIGKYCYTMNFQSLVCRVEGTTCIIDCNLDMIQFYRFKKVYNGPNYKEDGCFKLMYPKDECNYSYDEKTNHLVINTGLYWEDDEQETILSYFEDFINLELDLSGQEIENFICKMKTPSKKI